MSLNIHFSASSCVSSMSMLANFGSCICENRLVSTFATTCSCLTVILVSIVMYLLSTVIPIRPVSTYCLASCGERLDSGPCRINGWDTFAGTFLASVVEIALSLFGWFRAPSFPSATVMGIVVLSVSGRIRRILTSFPASAFDDFKIDPRFSASSAL